MDQRPNPFVPRTLALVVAAAFAGHVSANSGRVEFVFGGATLRNAQGDRPLVRGADLRTGDAVITTDGRAQIRFSDGAFVSLQPNTEFKIDEYRFDGQADGNESGIFALAKGAMRTVTGLVGRANRSKYQVRTPTATVGIRGTGGIISVLLDGSTLVRGTTGIWTLANQLGASIDVPAGRAGLAGTDQSQPPKESAQGPSAPPAPPTQQTSNPSVSPAEIRTADGNSVVVALQDTGQSIGVVFAEFVDGLAEIGTFFLPDIAGASVTVKGDIGSAGQLTGFTFRETASGDGFKLTFSGTLNEAGSNSTVSWGRWTGPVTFTSITGGASQSVTTEAYGPNGGFHYAIGVPTAQMPTTGSFSYSMIGATAPTHQGEIWAPGHVSSANFKGQFTPTGGMVGMEIYYSIGGSNWKLQSPGGTCSPSISIAGNTFAGSGTNQIIGVTCGPCVSACGAQMTGGFAGTGASYAGVAYKGQVVPGADAHVGGVVVFSKNAVAP